MRIGILVTGAALAAVFIAGLMWGLPQYGVWQQELAGRAELVRAEQNRRIAVLEAQARLEAEELNAQAEIARAHGVAEANAIVAEGLGGPEGYLRYLWIQSLGENGQDVIYIPTEAGLPILEASRHIAQ
ncbi:membrane protease subunit [Maricaulis alexandrii]|uniref:membrane protease subunit n=1 Tax=Maricaulis alexandrii TaxID=2570354 RepID=UPI0011086577|nr:membrane protease subunit [Maricaulis alexandrii]